MIQRYEPLAGATESSEGEYYLKDDIDTAMRELIDTYDLLVEQKDREIAELRVELLRWKAVSPDRCNLEYIIALEKEITELREKLAAAVKALEEIVDPISFIRSRMKEGEQLNGTIAVYFSESPVYLKDIAKKALKEAQP
jgi:hypothetical protein